MTSSKAFLLVLFSLAFISCEKTNTAKTEIFGNWEEVKWENETVVFKSVPELTKQCPGFGINKTGEFIEIANAGWCGTPPISYAEYKGSCEFLSDSLLSVKVPYWGGEKLYDIQIISLENNELKVKYIWK